MAQTMPASMAPEEKEALRDDIVETMMNQMEPVLAHYTTTGLEGMLETCCERLTDVMKISKVTQEHQEEVERQRLRADVLQAVTSSSKSFLQVAGSLSSRMNEIQGALQQQTETLEELRQELKQESARAQAVQDGSGPDSDAARSRKEAEAIKMQQEQTWAGVMRLLDHVQDIQGRLPAKDMRALFPEVKDLAKMTLKMDALSHHTGRLAAHLGPGPAQARADIMMVLSSLAAKIDHLSSRVSALELPLHNAPSVFSALLTTSQPSTSKPAAGGSGGAAAGGSSVPLSTEVGMLLGLARMHRRLADVGGKVDDIQLKMVNALGVQDLQQTLLDQKHWLTYLDTSMRHMAKAETLTETRQEVGAQLHQVLVGISQLRSALAAQLPGSFRLATTKPSIAAGLSGDAAKPAAMVGLPSVEVSGELIGTAPDTEAKSPASSSSPTSPAEQLQINTFLPEAPPAAAGCGPGDAAAAAAANEEQGSRIEKLEAQLEAIQTALSAVERNTSLAAKGWAAQHVQDHLALLDVKTSRMDSKLSEIAAAIQQQQLPVGPAGAQPAASAMLPRSGNPFASDSAASQPAGPAILESGSPIYPQHNHPSPPEPQPPSVAAAAPSSRGSGRLPEGNLQLPAHTFQNFQKEELLLIKELVQNLLATEAESCPSSNGVAAALSASRQLSTQSSFVAHSRGASTNDGRPASGASGGSRRSSLHGTAISDRNSFDGHFEPAPRQPGLANDDDSFASDASSVGRGSARPEDVGGADIGVYPQESASISSGTAVATAKSLAGDSEASSGSPLRLFSDFYSELLTTQDVRMSPCPSGVTATDNESGLSALVGPSGSAVRPGSFVSPERTPAGALTGSGNDDERATKWADEKSRHDSQAFPTDGERQAVRDVRFIDERQQPTPESVATEHGFDDERTAEDESEWRPQDISGPQVVPLSMDDVQSLDLDSDSGRGPLEASADKAHLDISNHPAAFGLGKLILVLMQGHGDATDGGAPAPAVHGLHIVLELGNQVEKSQQLVNGVCHREEGFLFSRVDPSSIVSVQLRREAADGDHVVSSTEIELSSIIRNPDSHELASHSFYLEGYGAESVELMVKWTPEE